ncbi:MAG: phospholipase D-like domain-containing protein [Saprospiraceae bacterium]
MKILSNPDLVREIRNCSDLTNNRLWVAVPYIGSWNSVAKIIGNRWVKNSQLKVRLLTDIEERTAFCSDTLKIFRGHALVKHLLGLHAKIYVFDEKAIITSANLTRAAFMKREVGCS